MTKGIYTVNDELISPYVKEAYLIPEVTQITRRLLDGSWHIQTIGKAGKRLKIAMSTYEEGKNTIDAIHEIGGIVKVVNKDKIWTGYIDTVDWEYVFKGLYNADMQLLVVTEADNI